MRHNVHNDRNHTAIDARRQEGGERSLAQARYAVEAAQHCRSILCKNSWGGHHDFQA